MKLRRLFCFLLATLFFICGVFSSIPCGQVQAAEVGMIEYNGVSLPDINTVWTDKSTFPCAFITTANTLIITDFQVKRSGSNLVFASSGTGKFAQYVKENDNSGWWRSSGSDTYPFQAGKLFMSVGILWSNYDVYYVSGGIYISSSVPVDPNAPTCSYTDVNCDNICDECGELLPMEYWSTELEYLVTAGYDIIEQTDAEYFCILYNKNDFAPDLIVGETKFEINSTGDVLLTKNPQLYKLFEWENGSFSHYAYDDISKTEDGLYLDPDHYIIKVSDGLRVLYSNHSIKSRYIYSPGYDPFGGGSTRGGGADRAQAQRFDIDVDTYAPLGLGGLPADPEYGSGRVDVVVSPSAPPVSVPISPTSPVVTPTPDPVPVVTPTPDPSDPNSIIIQNQITNIGNDLAALPDKVGEKITDKIGDSIKGLFVPSETDIRAVKEKWSLLLSDRFGAVYESASVIDGIIDAFVYEGDMETITFPSVTVDLAGTPFTFGGWEVDVVPERFRFLTTTSKLITSIVCTVLFVNGMKKKLEGLLAR